MAYLSEKRRDWVKKRKEIIEKRETKEDEERDIREKKWRGKAQRRGDRPER